MSSDRPQRGRGVGIPSGGRYQRKNREPHQSGRGIDSNVFEGTFRNNQRPMNEPRPPFPTRSVLGTRTMMPGESIREFTELRDNNNITTEVLADNQDTATGYSGGVMRRTPTDVDERPFRSYQRTRAMSNQPIRQVTERKENRKLTTELSPDKQDTPTGYPGGVIRRAPTDVDERQFRSNQRTRAMSSQQIRQVTEKKEDRDLTTEVLPDKQDTATGYPGGVMRRTPTDVDERQFRSHQRARAMSSQPIRQVSEKKEDRKLTTEVLPDKQDTATGYSGVLMRRTSTTVDKSAFRGHNTSMNEGRPAYQLRPVQILRPVIREPNKELGDNKGDPKLTNELLADKQDTATGYAGAVLRGTPKEAVKGQDIVFRLVPDFDGTNKRVTMPHTKSQNQVVSGCISTGTNSSTNLPKYQGEYSTPSFQSQTLGLGESRNLPLEETIRFNDTPMIRQRRQEDDYSTPYFPSFNIQYDRFGNPLPDHFPQTDSTLERIDPSSSPILGPRTYDLIATSNASSLPQFYNYDKPTIGTPDILSTIPDVLSTTSFYDPDNLGPRYIGPIPLPPGHGISTVSSQSTPSIDRDNHGPRSIGPIPLPPGHGISTVSSQSTPSIDRDNHGPRSIGQVQLPPGHGIPTVPTQTPPGFEPPILMPNSFLPIQPDLDHTMMHTLSSQSTPSIDRDNHGPPSITPVPVQPGHGIPTVPTQTPPGFEPPILMPNSFLPIQPHLDHTMMHTYQYPDQTQRPQFEGLANYITQIKQTGDFSADDFDSLAIQILDINRAISTSSPGGLITVPSQSDDGKPVLNARSSQQIDREQPTRRVLSPIRPNPIMEHNKPGEHIGREQNPYNRVLGLVTVFPPDMQIQIAYLLKKEAKVMRGNAGQSVAPLPPTVIVPLGVQLIQPYSEQGYLPGYMPQPFYVHPQIQEFGNEDSDNMSSKVLPPPGFEVRRPVMQSDMQQSLQGPLQSEVQQISQPNFQGPINQSLPNLIQRPMQGIMQGAVPTPLQRPMPLTLQRPMPPIMQGQIPPTLLGQIPPTVQGQIPTLQGPMPPIVGDPRERVLVQGSLAGFEMLEQPNVVTPSMMQMNIQEPSQLGINQHMPQSMMQGTSHHNPPMHVPFGRGQPYSRPTKEMIEERTYRSKLSANAKEFVPRGYEPPVDPQAEMYKNFERCATQVLQPESSCSFSDNTNFDNFLRLGGTPLNPNDPASHIVFNSEWSNTEMIEILSLYHYEVCKNPGIYDAFMKKLLPVFKHWLKFNETSSNLADYLFDLSVESPSFVYISGKMCEDISKILPSNLFRRKLIMRCKTICNNLEQQILEMDTNLLCGFILFLAELYVQMKNSEGHRLLELAQLLMGCFKEILKSDRPTLLDTFIKAIKLTGVYLDKDMLPEMNTLMEQAASAVETLSNEEYNITALRSIIRRRNSNWEDTTTTASDSTSTGDAHSTDRVNTTKPQSDGVRYGPDGQIITDEEESFLATQMAPLFEQENSDNEDDGNDYDGNESMDDEMQEAFEQFLLMVPDAK